MDSGSLVKANAFMIREVQPVSPFEFHASGPPLHCCVFWLLHHMQSSPTIGCGAPCRTQLQEADPGEPPSADC